MTDAGKLLLAAILGFAIFTLAIHGAFWMVVLVAAWLVGWGPETRAAFYWWWISRRWRRENGTHIAYDDLM